MLTNLQRPPKQTDPMFGGVGPSESKIPRILCLNSYEGAASG